MANGHTASQPQTSGLDTEEQFRGFYDGTVATAFSLACRVTQGDRDEAHTACEAAYLELWRTRVAAEDREAGLMALVRHHGIRIHRLQSPAAQRSAADAASYTMAETIARGLGALDPLGRRSVELAYFGGLNVADISDIVGQPATAVRQALRTALLALGALTRVGEETPQ